MRTSQNNDVAIQRVDERRYAVAVDDSRALCRDARGMRAPRDNPDREERSAGAGSSVGPSGPVDTVKQLERR